MNTLILAAAGSGSRLGELTRDKPKCLVTEPTYGRPILDHLYTSLSRSHSLEHIIIVGGTDQEAMGKILNFTEQFLFVKKPQIHSISGERRGVGYAFFQGIEVARSLGLQECILSISDGVARTYHALHGPDSQIVLGVTSAPTGTKKTFTTVKVDSAGFVLPENESPASESEVAVRGVYGLREAALEEYTKLFHHALKLPALSEPMTNAKGEFRVTWTWRELQRSGMAIGTADLGDMAEVNFPEDLQQFRKLYSKESA